jgi:hypothetical protein
MDYIKRILQERIDFLEIRLLEMMPTADEKEIPNHRHVAMYDTKEQIAFLKMLLKRLKLELGGIGK